MVYTIIHYGECWPLYYVVKSEVQQTRNYTDVQIKHCTSLNDLVDLSWHFPRAVIVLDICPHEHLQLLYRLKLQNPSVCILIICRNPLLSDRCLCGYLGYTVSLMSYCDIQMDFIRTLFTLQRYAEHVSMMRMLSRPVKEITESALDEFIEKINEYIRGYISGGGLLTPRLLQIVLMLQRGMKMEVIRSLLKISAKTLYCYREKASRILGCNLSSPNMYRMITVNKIYQKVNVQIQTQESYINKALGFNDKQIILPKTMAIAKNRDIAGNMSL